MKKITLILLPFLLLAGFGFINIGSRLPNPNYIGGIQYDGPYVLYKNDQLFVKSVFGDSIQSTIGVDSMALSAKAGLTLTVATDEPGKTFSVQLKKKLQVEKVEYKKVNKLVVLSDIEGNFSAFRKLLQNCGVIDTSYNWTFGNGHLVLVGDFFDRGDQVTEVLWLIYALEEKAKTAGGYVHFVLGNHEIMNLSGDLRYLQPKYFKSASLLNETYMGGLYGENSEIGRWLRTKNIVEKIGPILFAHGGISPEINRMDISLSRINEISRPFYPDTNYVYPDQKIDTIFSDLGPFWYRGYYKAVRLASTAQIDSTLEKFNVKIITTGHTIVSDTIRVLHNGKLINTDVHHAAGHSEAMLIEDGKYYRVTGRGEKFLILQ